MVVHLNKDPRKISVVPKNRRYNDGKRMSSQDSAIYGVLTWLSVLTILAITATCFYLIVIEGIGMAIAIVGTMLVGMLVYFSADPWDSMCAKVSRKRAIRRARKLGR